MPFTPLGLYYPGTTDTPKRQDLEDMAETADAAIALLGQWTAYTPTVTAATATAAARYTRIGDLVKVEFKISFTGAATGTVLLSKPVTGLTAAADIACGVAMGVDGLSSPSRRSMTVAHASTTNVFFLVDNLNTAATVVAAVPWTWANTDTLAGSFEYEAA